MQTIKVNFGYFWPDFNLADNYFTRVLSLKYKVEISEKPDLYFFTHAYNNQRDYLKYKCHRVFLGWENVRANWNCADYVLDSDFYTNNPRHKRWPIWAEWDTSPLLLPKPTDVFESKTKFACMVVSNAKAKERIAFFHKLSKYKQVDSGGRYLNNVGGPVANKRDFIKDYKFVISFENSTQPGYTTEKLIEPMLVNSIPIYWGNEQVGADFNSNSFVHVNSFKNQEAAIEYIIELDKQDQQYKQMQQQPWFTNNEFPKHMTHESLQQFFDFVIEDVKTKPPVATSFIKTSTHKLQVLTHKAEAAILARLRIEKGFR